MASLHTVLITVFMLASGSINTITRKAQLNTKSLGLKGSDGEEVHTFSHPWFQSLLMFIGEALCLLVLFGQRCAQRRPGYPEIGNEQAAATPRVFQWIFLLPTSCDLISTSLQGIALIYIDPSIFQMLRGSLIIFTALFARFFLKRKLLVHNWVGITVAALGVTVVSISTVLNPENSSGSSSNAAVGVLLVIGSQTLTAFQVILEEKFVKDKDLPTLQVVGMEGFFGVILMCALFLPVLQHIPGPQANNSYENTIDALIQIKNSPVLIGLCVGFIFSIMLFNYTGLTLSKKLSAVHRTLFDACRTVVIWAVSLIIFYGFGSETYGEKLDSWSVLKVDGFMLLVIGTSIYNQLIDLSVFCCKKNENLFVEVPEDEVQREEIISSMSKKYGSSE